MAKLIYILWRTRDLPVADLRARLFGEVIPQLLQLELERLAVNIADIDGAFGLPVVYPEGVVGALLSLQVSDEAVAAPIEIVLRPLSAKVAGYAVTEIVPRAYDECAWARGERTPGAKLVTCFPKPKRVSDDEFLQHWHGAHTKVALDVHPIWCYVSNVVERALTPGAPPFRGIVEEQFRALEDITDPDRFFGPRENVKRVVRTARQFLDFETVENYLMSEYLLRG